MTVTYAAEVATCRGFGCFLKLLFRWRGSIYKLVWLDVIAFLVIYYTLNISYRFIMDANSKMVFEYVVTYCEKYSNLIPLSFVLGFYVSIVMTRWWNQYTSMPWPDPLAVFVSSQIHGQDDRGRVMRRTIMRYVCLCLTMVLTMISPKVKKRFPSLEHFIDAGLLVENERDIMVDLNKKFPAHSKHWLPIVWASSIVTRARKEGRIRDDFAVKTLIDELNKFRGNAGLLLQYDMVNVPLVYTQVVTLAVYTYFITSAVARQWITTSTTNIDMYFPVFVMLEFFFYMGWLKVAESLINPWGDDDDDFEVNWIVDRNLQVSYIIVDEMHHEHPELIKDQYWDEVFPSELPYTLASEPFREVHPLPSTAHMDIPPNETELFAPSSVKADDMASQGSYEDDASGIHFSAGISRTRPSSQYSRQLSTGSISRVNSVSNVLRRLFSREESRTDGSTSASMRNRLPGSASSASLREKPGITGSMRIADQVIEEVDEQTTITSMQRGNADSRPTAMSVFGPPQSSDPVPIPSSKSNETQLSQSAPAATHDNIDMISVSSTEDDEFSKLKASREQERQDRILKKIVRSISIHPADNSQMEEALLTMQPTEEDSPPAKPSNNA